MLLPAYSQEAVSTDKKEKQKTDTLIKSDEETKVSIGKDLLTINEGRDNVRIHLGNRRINILESLEGGSKITIEKDDNNGPGRISNDHSNHHYRSHFQGHWAGIEWGFANYLTSDFSFVMPNDIYYMNLLSTGSQYFDINFIQQSFGFSRNFGLVTGMGLNWDCYRFEGNNSIVTGTNGVIRGACPPKSR